MFQQSVFDSVLDLGKVTTVGEFSNLNLFAVNALLFAVNALSS